MLIPWRPQRLRRIGAQYATESERLFGELLLLRTHYGSDTGDDEALAEWIDEAHPLPVDSFGGPKRSGSVSWTTRPTSMWAGSDGVPCTRPCLSWVPRECTAISVARGPPSMCGRRPSPRPTRTRRRRCSGILSSTTRPSPARFLLVADKEAFETGMLGLLFRDAKGNVVKHGRVKHDEVTYLDDYHCRGALPESEFWLQAVPGEMYDMGGRLWRRYCRWR